jgi:hypothetical protein
VLALTTSVQSPSAHWRALPAARVREKHTPQNFEFTEPTPINFGYRPGKLRRWCNGNGSADDSDALEAAFETGYEVSDTGAGLYRTTRKIIVPAATDIIVRGKVRLRPDLNGEPFLYAFDTSTQQTAGAALSRFIAVSARQGARTIILNSVADMNVGDRLVIRTETLWPYNNESTLVKGEVNSIAAINSGTSTITLSSPLQCEYNTSIDASYVETYLPNWCDIDGLEIDFQTFGTAGGGLGLFGLVDSSIRNVVMRNCGLVGISLGECYNVEVNSPTVVDGYLSGLGYGIQFNGGTFLKVLGGLLRNNRHGVDFSGNLPCHMGLVESNTCIGNTAEGSCYGSHGAGNRLVYRNNLMSNSVAGVQARSPNNVVQGNHYHGIGSFIVQVGAPGLIARGNTQVVNSIEPQVGANQLADAYFLELGDGGDGLLFEENQPTAMMEIVGNSAQPLADFIVLQSDVDVMRRLVVADNDICFQGGTHHLINADAVSGGTTIKAGCVIAPNRMTFALGGFVALNNIAIENQTAFDGDATPSVLYPSHGDIFYVANTSPATITGFDDAFPGQEITVFVNDSQTTIDFTGTALRGNGGIDYAPAAPFVLRGKFDGQQWFCTVEAVA